MPEWRTDPATRRERRPSRRVMLPRGSSRRARGSRLDRPGPERPCRSPRTRPRGDRPGSARGARRGRGAVARRPRLRPARGDGRPPQAGAGPGRRRTASSTAASLPDGSAAARGCRCGSTWSSWSPGDRVRHHRHAMSASRRSADRPDRTRATLPPGPGSARAEPPNRPRHDARGAHTRTVPTGAVPAGRGATGPRRRGPRRKQPTGGHAPCRPFRCGSCSRPESTSATRPAAGIPR